MATKLQPGQTATPRRIFTLPAETCATRFAVDRRAGAPARWHVIGGSCGVPAATLPPAAIE